MESDKLRGCVEGEDGAICRDILKKLKETNQIYIVSHDYPISISRGLFSLLEKKRKQLAKEKGIPETQMEFEDVLGKFLLGTDPTVELFDPKTGEVVLRKDLKGREFDKFLEDYKAGRWPKLDWRMVRILGKEKKP